VRVLEGGTKTLEEAQRNKMDHVCRKVQLKPGETFVDVGSGWGGLLFPPGSARLLEPASRNYRAGGRIAGRNRSSRARGQDQRD
jgi:hypothetical protein